MNDQPQNGAAAEAKPPQMKILGQFVRDLSFENIAAQKGTDSSSQPDVQVQVNLDATKRSSDSQYEVATKLNISAKTKDTGDVIFALELDYAGVFQIDNVPEEQIHPFLLIECPRTTFPFLRRIVSDVTRDGGFPPLNLEMIDFMALYRQEVARRTAAKQASGGTAQA
ncbi:MAG: protein-export chaperone SecB [Pseudomonadota bacterium]